MVNGQVRARAGRWDASDFSFEREVRTPYTEAYTIRKDDRAIGRIGIHFADGVVHLSVAVYESLTRDSIQEIIDTVDAVDIARERFVVHVFQGRETSVFSDEGRYESGNDQ